MVWSQQTAAVTREVHKSREVHEKPRVIDGPRKPRVTGEIHEVSTRSLEHFLNGKLLFFLQCRRAYLFLGDSHFISNITENCRLNEEAFVPHSAATAFKLRSLLLPTLYQFKDSVELVFIHLKKCTRKFTKQDEKRSSSVWRELPGKALRTFEPHSLPQSRVRKGAGSQSAVSCVTTI